jgi:hypothetical protein
VLLLLNIGLPNTQEDGNEEDEVCIPVEQELLSHEEEISTGGLLLFDGWNETDTTRGDM